MAVLYHLFHFACLSPPTSRIALRLGSKTNRMRISLCPAEPGRSSFIDLTRRDPLILPTSGRLRFGPCSFNISNAARTCILDSRSSEFSQSLTSSSSMVYISINIPQEVYLYRFASCEDTLQPTHHTRLRRGSRGATPRPLRIPERWPGDHPQRRPDGRARPDRRGHRGHADPGDGVRWRVEWLEEAAKDMHKLGKARNPSRSTTCAPNSGRATHSGHASVTSTACLHPRRNTEPVEKTAKTTRKYHNNVI